MVKRISLSHFLIVFLIGLTLLPFVPQHGFAAEEKTYIYDNAGLLTDEEKAKLAALAAENSEKQDTDFIVLTTDDSEVNDIKTYIQDFYDETMPGSNAAILGVDMNKRDFYVAGFYKAEELLSNERADLVVEKITPYLSDREYAKAFETFIVTAEDYMTYRAGVNPDNILFKWWFQIVVALVVAGGIVGVMVYNSGGKVTVHQGTYLDQNRSSVLAKKDTYVRTSVTKTRKPQNNKSSGGGGTTSGGHSHSGSRGSF
ncbi:TPM domain-containing protein [Aureibacillus halotolerans]|uniref:TPM domain-containing protein n=1 Tax=Aureibacillus halotolerans TaxID=1508390 RepID=A0A4R6TSF6_9BACI|nr:TPM domain-containing protein [Aureibacillus halotolerans]TDQ36231.1 uncharacterized protein EV213_11920 [Aureibacillus halotolerans]